MDPRPESADEAVETVETVESAEAVESTEAVEARDRMIKRFKNVRIVSSLVFILTVAALIYFVRSGMANRDVQNIRFALLYVFGAVVLALSIMVVIACFVILRRLEANKSDD